MKKQVALHNLGCKVNAYELEAMQQLLEEDGGYEIVPFVPGADIYIINTCTVTNIADRKSRQMLHRAKKMNPNALVVATGCYVQAKGTELEKDPAIDIVIGNNKKGELISILKEYERDTEHYNYIIDINRTHDYEELAISQTAEHTRAYIKVQDGCNQFCTYCIIPYARGRVRSRRKEEVVAEVMRLAGNGCREVVLTGIHLSSYGVDLEEKETLLTLIRAVHAVDGIDRIRLGSLEPGIVTEEFAQAIAELPKVCPHFHLSMQSGCDATLKRMNRRYDTEQFYDRCRILRKYYEKPAITTDIIAGFPGETQEEFECTRAFVDRVDFYETHVFKYSRREGTKAAVMDGQVPEQVKAERSHALIALGEEHKAAYLKYFEGKTLEVLFEEKVVKDGETWWMGHSREYIRAGVRCDENLENAVLQVRAGGAVDNEWIVCERM
ncbi:MAG TPA: tRNA (N(6)-L-threonylcarbamoyladenosine(37)-C(2))-methylthiotransferase MtaB [Candidatus Egerieimonas faecigallinarum]|nr:tRNA (N(6)-L-threonylcarbamoyladenosine(37)-C(2))-methylthiotransferase MtaB [Candidatus Egerieimonas faecigallinarum]